MDLRKTILLGSFALATLFWACADSDRSLAPSVRDLPPTLFTRGSGSTSTLLGRATFSDPADQVFKVKRISGDWHAEVKAKPNLDLAVQRIVFQPSGQSGWHRHPGPVFIQVVAGTMTFYESDDPDCTPIVRSAGQGYLDAGEHAHIARNESGAPSEVIVVYLAPQAAALRIDAADPGHCPF